MKCLLIFVVVLVFMPFATVNGITTVENELTVNNNLTVDQVTYGEDDFLRVGASKIIRCVASNRKQRMQWIDPNGQTVRHLPGSRIFSEAFVSLRSQVLLLTITNALVHDSGVYQCQAGDLVKNVSLCVIEPSSFVDTLPKVVADLGRSITLSCEVKGDPEPRFQWSRNGEIIIDEDSSSRYRIFTKFNTQSFESLLTIISVEPEDSGVYSCSSIQESSQVEECRHTQTFNVTLNINYPPIFEGGNQTKFVYGKNDEEVDMFCSADGYPVPTYRWFKVIDDDLLYEFTQKQIKLIGGNSQAVMTIVANQSTFGQKYMCLATNNYGDSYKYFTLLKSEKPGKPSKVNLYNSTNHSLLLNVTWYEDTYFPIDAYAIQYILQYPECRTLTPSLEAWKGSNEQEVKLPDVQYVTPNLGSLMFRIIELQENTTYWIRLQVKNEFSDSLWSDPILVSTAAEEEEIAVTSTVAPTAAETKTESIFSAWSRLKLEWEKANSSKNTSINASKSNVFIIGPNACAL